MLRQKSGKQVNHRQLSPIEDGMAAAKPQNQEMQSCFHCESNKAALTSYCEVWRIWCCANCFELHHKGHHLICERSKKIENQDFRTHYTVRLTSFEGKVCMFTCKLGFKLQLEDHWMGTYVVFPGCLILVQEKRAVIHERVLEGLKTYNMKTGMKQ